MKRFANYRASPEAHSSLSVRNSVKYLLKYPNSQGWRDGSDVTSTCSYKGTKSKSQLPGGGNTLALVGIPCGWPPQAFIHTHLIKNKSMEDLLRLGLFAALCGFLQRTAEPQVDAKVEESGAWEQEVAMGKDLLLAAVFTL